MASSCACNLLIASVVAVVIVVVAAVVVVVGGGMLLFLVVVRLLSLRLLVAVVDLLIWNCLRFAAKTQR